MYNYEIQKYVDRIDGLKTVDGFKDAMFDLRSDFGFDHMVYTCLRAPNTEMTTPHFVTTYNDEWVNRYAEKDYKNVDPVVLVALNSSMPFQWSDLKCNKKQQQFFNEAEDFGIRKQGITIPIHGIQNETAIFCFTSGIKDEIWDKELREKFANLYTISSLVHNNFVNNALPKIAIEESIQLTDREKECLLWTARGKSSWEIGEILNLSERTVNFHIQNACNKFGATNKLHAVVKAISQNLCLP